MFLSGLESSETPETAGKVLETISPYSVEWAAQLRARAHVVRVRNDQDHTFFAKKSSRKICKVPGSDRYFLDFEITKKYMIGTWKTKDNDSGRGSG